MNWCRSPPLRAPPSKSRKWMNKIQREFCLRMLRNFRGRSSPFRPFSIVKHFLIQTGEGFFLCFCAPFFPILFLIIPFLERPWLWVAWSCPSRVWHTSQLKKRIPYYQRGGPLLGATNDFSFKTFFAFSLSLFPSVPFILRNKTEDKKKKNQNALFWLWPRKTLWSPF